MKYIYLFVFILTHSVFYSQVTDSFTDGDFTTNPTWAGTDLDFIVSGAMELQLNSVAAGTSYLSTSHNLADLNNKEWNFKVRQSFSPSSSNYGRVYLTASSADLSSDPDGFYLQFGEAGSLDAVKLFKVESGVNTELMSGSSAQIASSFEIGVRVVRDNLGVWELFLDPNGGTAYSLEASVTDATNLLGTHFGVFDVYTVSNATNFYYDDFYIGDEILDLTPPDLVDVIPIDADNIDMIFNEGLDPTNVPDVNNYDIQPFLSVTSAVLDGVNPTIIHLTLGSSMTNGASYEAFAFNMQDLSGNTNSSQSVNYQYLVPEIPSPGDIVINEFMCDPSPVIGLPELEFVEIYNRSNKIFDVQDWKLGDASSNGTIQQGYLLPGEYMVLTATANVDSFNVATAVSSFPSLNNSGDNIILRSDLGVNLDSISYTSNWYNDPNKEGGGYTIERINPDDPCTDFSDWSGSNDPSGGTPGAQNSVYDTTPDLLAPEVDQMIALAPSFLEIYFTEGMDSTSLADAVITTNPTLTIQNVYVLEEHPTMMTIQFQEAIVSSQNYSITLENIADCWLNSTTFFGQFALPDPAASGDLIINEILFNPITGGSDWVELYNNSDKLIDLYQMELANWDDDTISNNKVVEEHFLIYPDSYAVISSDTTHILQNFPAATPGRFIESDLPSYSNEEGTVYLISAGQVLDEVPYSSDWHFKLIDNEDGKSLERIDPDGASFSESNWHTAAEAIGFGTPGGRNSQYYPAVGNGDFSYTNEIISPDNDGFQDVLQVNYELTEPGYLGTFTIYDDRGRVVAVVMKSEILAAEGTFTWQGVKDDGTKASIGTYVGVFEAFKVDGGALFAKRKAFVLAGKL